MKHTMLVAIVVVCVVVVVAGIFLIPKGGGPQGGGENPPGGENAALTQLTFSNSGYDPDWSPDGSKLVFCYIGESDELWVINADGTGPVKIGNGFDPSWSPVEDKIAYTLNGEIYTMTSNGQNITKLTTEGGATPTWSPDGTKIAYAIRGSILVMNADGSEATALTTLADGQCSWPSFSHDGAKIVYIQGPASGEEGEQTEPNEIWVMENDGTNKQEIYSPTDSCNLIFQRAWNKDDKILFMRCWTNQSSPDVWAINPDGTGASAVVEGAANCYGDPVWNNAGDKIAIIITTSQTSQNIFTLPWP